MAPVPLCKLTTKTQTKTEAYSVGGAMGTEPPPGKRKKCKPPPGQILEYAPGLNGI